MDEKVLCFLSWGDQKELLILAISLHDNMMGVNSILPSRATDVCGVPVGTAGTYMNASRVNGFALRADDLYCPTPKMSDTNVNR